ncbi:hypothetical protein [Streptomyces atratus]|uniref:hypothetical protein n=1 Tax=Streptomyces atratus TaxID=1893 RepID=UPI0037B854B7
MRPGEPRQPGPGTDDKYLQDGEEHGQAAQTRPVDQHTGERAEERSGEIAQRHRSGRAERARVQPGHREQRERQGGDLAPHRAGCLFSAEQRERAVAKG